MRITIVLNVLENCIWSLIFVLTGTVACKAQTSPIIHIDKDLQLVQLQDSIYIHTSWVDSKTYGRYPSNGLVIIEDGNALLIDTPAEEDETELLTRYIKDSFHTDAPQVIISHFHNDCLGGLSYLHNKGIHSIANSRTIEKCKDDGFTIPKQSFTDSLLLQFNGLPVELQFFGGGHSFDNIVVWLPAYRILFGGCLVRAEDAIGLGNLSDARVDEWDSTIIDIINAYPELEIVIPGHGSYGGPALLAHTLALIKKHKNELD